MEEVKKEQEAQESKEVARPRFESIMDNPEAKAIVTSLVIEGDISKLTPSQRVVYYQMYCESLGLNPLTKPFDILKLGTKIVLYANKDCAAQLRQNHGVAIDDIKIEKTDDIYSVIVKGHNRRGATDCEIGVVPIKGLKGEALANAMMKGSTKAKRRLTLSLCGLSALDETEVDSIPGAVKITNYETLTVETPPPSEEQLDSELRTDGDPDLKSFPDEHIATCPSCNGTSTMRSKYPKNGAWYCKECKIAFNEAPPVQQDIF